MFRKTHLLLILALVLGASYCAFINPGDPTIISVSSRIEAFVPATGSLLGGTLIYLKGTNFHPEAANNRIWVGPYPCLIPSDGAKIDTLSCRTTAATDPAKVSNLPVMVSVVTEGVVNVTCSDANCRFSYREDQTPAIEEIIPRSAVGDTTLAIFGTHRITELGDGRSHSLGQVQELKIQDYICSMVDIVQNDDDFDPNSRRAILCKSDVNQDAGEYAFTELVQPGWARQSIRAYQTSYFTGKNYTQRVLPKIQSVSSHVGGNQGQVLTLKGRGFVSDLSAYNCKIAGINCTVVEARKTELSVKVDASSTTFTPLTQDPSDSSNQTSPFVGSQGALYRRYAREDMWKALTDWPTYLRGTPTNQLLSEKIVTELSTGQVYGSDYVQYIQGYFYAPVDGDYRFNFVADDDLIMLLSSVKNNANPANLQVLLQNSGYINDHYISYVRDNQTANEVTKTLTAGYYYFETVALNYGGSGFFKVSVSTPQVTTYTINPTWQIDRVRINTDYDSEIIKVRVFGASGKFSLFYWQNSIKYEAQVSIGASASSFYNALWNLRNMYDQVTSVTRVSLNAAGAVTSTAGLTEGYEYTITLDRYRPTTPLPSTDITNLVASANVATSIAVTRTSNHSAPIGGTFRLLVGGTPLTVNGVNTLPYTVKSWDIEAALNRVYPGTEIKVRKVIGTSPEDIIDFIIEYVGLAGPAQALTLETITLTGGKAGTTPSGVVSTPRLYSSNPLYSPIPFQFLNVPSAKPAVQITVNSIPSVCQDCSYEFNAAATPQLTTATLSGATLTLALSNPGSLTFTTSDITVTLLGQPCTDIAGTTSAFTCTLPINVDSSVALPAGTAAPQVHVVQIGYADASAVTPFDVSLVVTSFSPAETSPGAGIVATVVGTGLPVNAQGLSIEVCGNLVTEILTTTNQQITFVLPAQNQTCDGSNNVISYGGKTATFTFAYNPALTPTITSLSKTSSSPILKSSLTITGTGFGSTASTKVYLVQNNTRKYQLNTISATSTSIDVVLGGGKTGDYNIIVVDASNGQSLLTPSSQFSYKIIVNSLSPVSGHVGGGYDITITGSNFATAAGSTQVFIGNAKNSICTIVSVTATTIVCTVPRNIEYTPGDALEVVVAGRILQESVCEGTCSFTYQATGASIIDVPANTTYKAGDSVTVTGTGLNNASISVNGVACNITANTDTSVTFVYPPLPAGNYQVLIKVANGWTSPALNSMTQLVFGSASSTQVSQDGMRYRVAGNGFPKSGVAAWLVCPNETKSISVLSTAPAEVFIDLPSTAATSALSCRVNVTVGTRFNLYSLSYSPSYTFTGTISGSGLGPYTFTRTNLLTTTFTVASVDFVWLDSAGNPTNSIYRLTGSSTFSATYLPAGTFAVRIHSTAYGYARVTPATVTVNFPADPTASATTSSFVGGKTLTLSGAGFVTNNVKNNEITVCGIRANVVSATQSQAVVEIPALVTTTTQGLYSLATVDKLRGTPFGDTAQAPLVSDDSFNTVYTSSGETCFVGINFGDNTQADISRIRFAPNPTWAVAANKLAGAVFQGSNDGTTYSPIFPIDTSSVHSGWNTWAKEAADTFKFQYIRFRHTNVSACQLAQLEVYGIKYSTLAVTAGVDKQCDVRVVTQNKILSNIVTYAHNETTIVSSISPKFGPSTGNTVLTIQGSGFGTVTVTIDGIDCVVLTSTSTEITCRTGLRANPPAAGNSFVLVSNGNVARIATRPYAYIDRWSNEATWGGEALPREGDSVFVPKGMTLLVDVSTPILNTVIVEGKIQFANEADLTFDTHYFVINQGEFEAGTEEDDYDYKLTFTLYGGYFDKQLPTLGNKNIGCRNCKFNMHGKQRLRTWTQVSSTISPGDTTFSVIDPIDWVAGEVIAVAATSFDHYETEEKVIASVSGQTITVTTPFKYRHFAAVETYGSEQFVMRAEVGLLTRNIVMKGDDSSVDNEYGSHLMLTGSQAKGLVGKISYAEFTKCGQPKIVGRYCTHFHMAGDVPESYVRGISVHHSFARVLTIHGTHFLTVEKNVGFHVRGHNIFVEDGIETNNVIQDNLMMSTISSNTMLQTDMTVASYWITNPYNTVRRNHAAGGDFYGLWYEIKEHPDGPSATSDICPMGMQLGISRDNVAHSNRRFGMRIFKLSARQYPCETYQDESLLDPYSANPAIHSLFQNFTLWKNQQCGFLGEQLGYTTIKGFKTIDSRKGGLQFHKTNFTKQLVVADDCLVVGYSSGNAPADLNTEYNNARGVIASRTDGLKFQGIRFYNFGPTMTPLQSCSECWNFKLWVVGSKTTEFENISYNNIQGNYIFWQKWRREIFVDNDGSLTEPFRVAITPAIPSQSRATITPYRASLMLPGKCYTSGNAKWDNSIYCDQSVILRSILFTNGLPFIDFNAIDIKVKLLTDSYENITDRVLFPESTFGRELMIIIKKKSMDIPNSWAMPFASGYTYNVHWKWGIDFLHMNIAPSRLWTENDGVVLRFNYSDHRELYQIGKWFKKQLQLPYIVAKNTTLDPLTCENGDYFHDQDARYLFVCVSGRNKTIREWTDITGIRCINFCPTEQTQTQREDFFRLWSNATQWPGGVLPSAGQNVTIPYEWKLLLDIDPPVFNFVTINGLFLFDRTRDNKFQANYIWVKQGDVKIGSSDSPFTKNVNIILHGNKNSSYLVIDPDASGNKMLAITGSFEAYGVKPSTIWTRLTSTAVVNATSIQVASASGWKVGDEIVIAPSYAGRKEFEEVVITSISGNTVSFTPALQFEHYGAPGVTLTNDFGTLDARTAVGLLTRNIKITGSADIDNWGCRILVYGYNELNVDPSRPPTWRKGYVKFNNIEIDKCSQYDSTYAAVRLQNLIPDPSSTDATTTEIVDSAIHDCKGFCMYIKQVQDVHINNNVFFWARKFLVYVEEVISNYNFTNNLLVGTRKRDEVITIDTMMHDDVAAYEQYLPINFAGNHRVNVTNNLAQGSQGQGFVFPFTPCEYIASYPFVQNTAGSCETGVMYENKINGLQCLAARGIIAYACEMGHVSNPQGSWTKVIYKNMFFADSGRGITLRFAHEIDDNTHFLQDSYFTGISRPNCTSCYSDSAINYCSDAYAVRMFTATITGQSFPLKKKPQGFDVICTQQAFDFKAFLKNVTFENYLYNNPSLPYCSRMSVFRRHPGASDGTGSHILSNTRCINCEEKSLAFFDRSSPGIRGWFGGCGEMDCTGASNYLIHDTDGIFTGTNSSKQLLSNNSWIGDNQPFCRFVSEMNGHVCNTDELAVLEYESIAPDFNSRKMWPTYLKYEGGNWNSTTNAWKEWEWDGPEPMNKRLARFWSVIRLHQRYNLTFAAQPPSDTRFQIQKRVLPTGNEADWAIIKIYYPLPNSIEVRVKNTTGTDILVKPFPLRQGVAVDLLNYTDVCGANNFYYQEGKIEFVVNGKSNCQVRVRLSSFIQLSARIDIPIADFYTNNGPTSFITNICAFLGIDTGRMKIVSIREGSAIVTAVITNDPVSLNVSTTTPYDPSASQAALNNIADRLNSGIASIPLGGALLSHSTSVYTLNIDGSEYVAPEEQKQAQAKNNTTLIIVLCVVIPVVIVAAAVTGFCYWKRKRAQIHESEIINNKSSANREHIKGSTEFEISATDAFAMNTKYSNKKWGEP